MSFAAGSVGAVSAVRDRWLVALDVDGTIVHEDDTLSPRVAAAIRAVAAAGHVVTIATGRAQWGAENAAQRVGVHPAYLVSANGALVLRARDDGFERMHVATFDASEVLEQLRKGLPSARFMVEDVDGHRRYTSGMRDWNLSTAEEVPFERLAEREAMRVVMVSPDHSVEQFLEIVDGMGLHQVTYAIGFSSWLDIAPDGVNKATGLEIVLAETGIPRERVLAVGDGRNDIDMLEWVAAGGGRAVSMGQAPPEVHAAANESTAVVEEDGLALVLEPLAAMSALGNS